mgnify:CR=1 FL=1|jgi:hypothetical protein
MAIRAKGSVLHKMTDDHRLKIANSNILSRLIAHAEGSQDMKQSEVTAGLALLKKVLPDLQNTTVETGEGGLVITIARDVSKL